MQKSLMQGLDQKGLEAVVNSYDLKALYYPTLFPIKQTYGLSIKALEAQTGLRIAGDLVARGATIDAKTREAINKIMADIPKLAIKREMDEDELNEYDIMLAMTSGNRNLRQLVEVWANDTEYCWNGIANRLEWMALQTLSRGVVTITNNNNQSVVTEYDLDYQMPADQKLGYISDAWSNASSAKPITRDFKVVVETAKSKGFNVRHAFMSLETFSTLAQTDEAIKMSASFAQNALNIAYTPGINELNAALRQQAYLYGLQIHVIDQSITIELPNGERRTVNPFEEGKVTFTEGTVMGTTYYKTPSDMNVKSSVALKTMNGHTCIKKYSTEEPLTEVTVGIANALPVWTSSNRSIILDTKNSHFTLAQ